MELATPEPAQSLPRRSSRVVQLVHCGCRPRLRWRCRRYGALVQWTPENVISLASVGVSAITATTAAVVAVTTSRRQLRGEAAGRRRDAHLRFWQAANTALRLLQERAASMRQPDLSRDLPPTDELDEALRASRATFIELEIVSPTVAGASTPVLAALELAHMELDALAAARSRIASGAPAGAEVGRRMSSSSSDLDAARRALNGLQRMLSAHEARGRLPKRNRPATAPPSRIAR